MAKIKVKTATVAEVHEDIDSLHAQLIAQAEELVSDGTTQQLEVWDKMLERGFWKVPGADEGKAQMQKFQQAKRMGELALNYRDKYPHNKFVTVKGVEYICKKYALVYGPAHRFVSEIPDKNKQEIADFKVDGNDREDVVMQVIGKPEDFDLSGDWEVRGYKVVDADPIVLQPVRGGFLIVSKWGEEADIKEAKGVGPFNPKDES